MIDQLAIAFICRSLDAIEAGRIREPGIYRCCGVYSRVQMLLDCALDPSKEASLDLSDEVEWETNAICCAVKKLLRDLPEPLVPYNACREFITAGQSSNLQQCILLLRIHVQKLPWDNRKMLERIIRHLDLVSDFSNENLMTARNLAICFGPSLLRLSDDEELDLVGLKLRNAVVEILISHYSQIFESVPRQRLGSLFVSNICRNRMSILSARTLSASNSSKISGESKFEPTLPVRTSDVFESLKDKSFPSSETFCSGRDLSRQLLSSTKQIKTKHPPPPRTPTDDQVNDRWSSKVPAPQTDSPPDGNKSSGTFRIFTRLRETLSLRKLIMYFHVGGHDT